MAAYRGTRTLDRLGSSVTQHEVAGWLADWQAAWAGGVGALKAAQGRTELTTLPALIWQFTSTVTECQPSPVEAGRGSQVLKVGGDGGVAAGRRARHLLLRALWHEVKGVVVGVVVVVVGCETLVWLLQKAWHAWGYTDKAWEHAPCRSMS